MKNVKLLVWITQLGLSVALPPLGFVYLAIKCKNRYAWGDWVISIAIILGILCAIEGLRSSLKAIDAMSRNEKSEKPPVSFNDHD